MLARNRAGLSNMSETLKAAAERMRKRGEGEKQYWKELVELAGYPKSMTLSSDEDEGKANKPWSICLKFNQPESVQIKPDDQIATDVIIPIAADEGESQIL